MLQLEAMHRSATIPALLGLMLAAPAAGQGLGFTAALSYDGTVLRRAAEMPLRDVLTGGLVLTYEGDRPLDFAFVGCVVEDARLTRCSASESFRLEPGRTRVGSDRMMMSSLSNLIGDLAVPAGEAFPTDRYITLDRTVAGAEFIPAMDGSSKVGDPLGDLLATSVSDGESLAHALLVAPLPAEPRQASESEVRPVVAIIRKIGS